MTSRAHRWGLAIAVWELVGRTVLAVRREVLRDEHDLARAELVDLTQDRIDHLDDQS